MKGNGETLTLDKAGEAKIEVFSKAASTDPREANPQTPAEVATANGKVQVTVAPAEKITDTSKFFYRASVKK